MASRFLAPFSGRGLMPRDPFLDFRREMDRLFDESFAGLAEPQRGPFMLSPKIDVTRRDDGWEITAELPGVAREDIDLRLDGDMLTISGEKRDENKDEKNRFVERSYGSFTRSFQLPFTPDPGRIEADCEHGVLTIKVPKGAEQDRSRRIPIGGGNTIEGRTRDGEWSAIGKEWTGSTSETGEKNLSEEQAEKGQGAPA
jgi:HSP20 family protein